MLKKSIFHGPGFVEKMQITFVIAVRLHVKNRQFL